MIEEKKGVKSESRDTFLSVEKNDNNTTYFAFFAIVFLYSLYLAIVVNLL